MLENRDQVFRNLDNIGAKIFEAMNIGMDYALRDTVNYIKTEFVWNKNHRGFNDRTGLLRKSINHRTQRVGSHVYGWVYSNVEYAPYVEYKWEGKHAYMYPGVRDKERDIVDTIAGMIKKEL